MRYLSKRDDFLTESQLIKLLNETVVWYSSNLRDLLKSIYAKTNLQVANNLLDLEGKKLSDDITLLDISADGKYFTYKTLRNVKKMKEEGTLSDDTIIDWIEEDPELSDPLSAIDKIRRRKSLISLAYSEDDKIWQEPRQQIKIGRFINNTLKGVPNEDVEKLTTKIKNAKLGLDLIFEVVEGEEIRKWYNLNSYASKIGTLGDSCMRYEKCSDYFDIYVKNPDICKMVCLLEEVEESGKTIKKLVARAIIWKVTEKSSGNFEWLMDRRYFSEEHYDDKLKDYAANQGWAYKTVNSFSAAKSVTFNGDKFDCNMKIQLNNEIEYKKFPYMDTFRRFYTGSSILENNTDDRPEEEVYYILNDTNGSFKKIEKSSSERGEPVDGQVFSTFHNEWLDEHEAYWSERESSYLYEDDCVWCQDLNDYIHTDDAVYSEPYNEYILADDACQVVNHMFADGRCNSYAEWYYYTDENIMDLEDFEDVMWYEWVKKKFSGWWTNQTKIHISLLMDDWEDTLIPKILKRDTYRVVSGDFEKDFYLTEDDANFLKLEIDKSDSRVQDAISYDFDIANYGNETMIVKIKSNSDRTRVERLNVLPWLNF